MEPIVNLDESPGKTVGRRRPPSNGLDPLTSRKADAVAWTEAFQFGGIPRGVYRFNSHEEADEWLWKVITRKKKG